MDSRYTTPNILRYFKEICKEYGYSCSDINPLALTAIITFMSSFDTIGNQKTKKMTYKQFLDLFFSSSIFYVRKPCDFQRLLKEKNWSTKKQLIAYSQLTVVIALLEGQKYSCEHFFF